MFSKRKRSNRKLLLLLTLSRMGKMVSVVDDDEIFHFLLTKQLAKIRDDISLICFSNGLDAFNHFRIRLNDQSQIPTLLFLDINMPIMDGWEFIEHLSTIQIDELRICFVTCSLSLNDRARAENSRFFYRYFIKPIDISALNEMIKDLWPAL